MLNMERARTRARTRASLRHWEWQNLQKKAERKSQQCEKLGTRAFVWSSVQSRQNAAHVSTTFPDGGASNGACAVWQTTITSILLSSPSFCWTRLCWRFTITTFSQSLSAFWTRWIWLVRTVYYFSLILILARGTERGAWNDTFCGFFFRITLLLTDWPVLCLRYQHGITNLWA